MGGDYGVWSIEHGVIGRRRFNVEHVGAVSADFARMQGINDVLRVDDFSTSAVQNHDSILHLRKTFPVNELSGLIGQVYVQTHHVALFQSFVNALGAYDLIAAGKVLVPIEVVA